MTSVAYCIAYCMNARKSTIEPHHSEVMKEKKKARKRREGRRGKRREGSWRKIGKKVATRKEKGGKKEGANEREVCGSE